MIMTPFFYPSRTGAYHSSLWSTLAPILPTELMINYVRKAGQREESGMAPRFLALKIEKNKIEIPFLEIGNPKRRAVVSDFVRKGQRL